MQTYFTIRGKGEAELIEKKSRFIGYAYSVASEEEAVEFVESIKAKHSDATHNVYAYQAGEQDEIQRSSDDGEPSGTAGRPVLEVIKKSNLKNTAVVVTRYFGGVLLGAGGLVRAYSRVAALALKKAGVVEKIPAKGYSLTMDYNFWGKVENLLNQNQKEYELLDTSFMEKITVFCAVSQDAEEGFLNKIREIGNGAITVLPLLNEYWLECEINIEDV
ncbi:MAG: YigZ family protein [Clostridia bacterium]|nr:YigZ family protein [Clostridia bacterium]